jgi:hypothetical protein
MVTRLRCIVVLGVLLMMVAVLAAGCSGVQSNSAPGTSSPMTNRPTETPRIQSTSPTLSGKSTPSSSAFFFEGEGSDETPTFTHFPGSARLTYTYSGKGSFMVWLLDGDGNEIDLLVDDIGSVSDWTKVEFEEPGLYMFGVDSDGEWTVSIT